MPCQDHQQLSSAFPAFPTNFKSDTPYFHQALSEQNFQRIAQGLTVQTFSELSHADRSKVLADAQALKDADRAREARPWWPRRYWIAPLRYRLGSFIFSVLFFFFGFGFISLRTAAAFLFSSIAALYVMCLCRSAGKKS